MLRSICLAAASAIVLSASAVAQPSPLEARYDAAIPTQADFLGHDFGEDITPPEEIIDYLKALADAAPDRMRVVDYATTWQGRTLAYGIITSAANMERIDEIQANMQRLADPRGLSDEARDQLIAESLPIVWLSYSVHGNEISPANSGLRTAYHLLAANNDPTVDNILENTVVIIDPIQNPDGRARFVHNFRQSLGLMADENRFAVEHDEQWPGGRFNHYLFDMNRDWFAMTQPESRGRVRIVQEWRPVVLVDSHEMGGDSTYFFAPSAEPFNPHIAAGQRAAQEVIGRNHARWFDRLGYSYFTREVYDAFYPGYGDMWPTLQGAVSMTYEQGSPRGLRWRRRDGSLLTFSDAVDHNFVASVSTAEVVANNRERFLREYTGFRAAAAADSSGPQAVLLGRAGNNWGADRLARNIADQGIEISSFSAGTSACGASFSEGGYIIRMDQPSGRLARTLLESHTDLPRSFMVEQEQRREAGLGHELYDVTAWSLPLMHNVDSVECRRAPQLNATTVAPGTDLTRSSVTGDASWGYAIAWEDGGQARLVAALAQAGVPMRATNEAFRIGSRTFPRGSVVIQRNGAPDNLDSIVRELAEDSGARVEGLASSWVDDGPNPGSSNFRTLREPRVAMLWGDGTSPTSAGATRYVLEQRYGIPVSVIRARTVSRADLSSWDVLILPEQGWSRFNDTLGSGGRSKIQGFVRDGGVLVGLGNATRWMADSEVGLIPAQRERAAGSPRDGSDDSEVIDGSVIDSQAALDAAEMPSGAMPDSSPGALLRVEANMNSWMASGYEDGATALVTGSDIYAPVNMDDATTALRFGGGDDLVQAGYLWAENTEQMAYKPFVIQQSMGYGQVVAFTQSPTTRAYLDGLDLLLLNAVILGPAQSRAYR